MSNFELDPNDPVEAVLIDMVQTNRRKRADYASEGNIFSNFIEASYQVGGRPSVAVEVLIATKQSRLRNLTSSGKTPRNESIEDTLLDRAVYSVLALAMYRRGVYNDDIVGPDIKRVYLDTAQANDTEVEIKTVRKVYSDR